MFLLFYVCVFSGWIEDFPCHRVNALTVANKLLDNVFPIGVPSLIPSDQGTDFTRQIMSLNKSLANFLELSLLLSPSIMRHQKELMILKLESL